MTPTARFQTYLAHRRSVGRIFILELDLVDLCLGVHVEAVALGLILQLAQTKTADQTVEGRGWWSITWREVMERTRYKEFVMRKAFDVLEQRGFVLRRVFKTGSGQTQMHFSVNEDVFMAHLEPLILTREGLETDKILEP